MNETGVKNISECVVTLTKIGVSVAQCVRSGKFSMIYFADDLASLPDAIEDIELVPEELKDLTQEEARQIIDLAMAELAPLGITDEEAIESFVTAAFSFIEGIMQILAGLDSVDKLESQSE